jgi:hypothetical protein
MKISELIKYLYSREINIGLARVFQLFGGFIIFAIILAYYNYEDSKVDYGSETEVNLVVLNVEVFRNENDHLTGYRLRLFDNEFPEKVLEYPVIGDISPLPKKNDSLPFSRLNVEGGKHKYIFLHRSWKQKYLGI